VPPDFDKVSRSFVKTLVENADAREELYAARHPPDHERTAAVVNKHSGADPPVTAADVPELLPVIARHVAETRAAGSTHIRADLVAGQSF
jgi:hypothetical protein